MSWAFKDRRKPVKPFKPYRGLDDLPAYPHSPWTKDIRKKLADWSLEAFEYYAKVNHWIPYRKATGDFYALSPRGRKWLIEVKSTWKTEFENPVLAFATLDASNSLEALKRIPGLNYGLDVYFAGNRAWKVCLNCEDVLKQLLPKVKRRNFTTRWRWFSDTHQTLNLEAFLAYH